MEECLRCKEVGEDRRTLWMACFYDMSELGLPFNNQFMLYPDDSEEDGKETTHNFYTLRVCKQCRSDWMHFIKMWFHIKVPFHLDYDTGIYTMDYDAPREVSEEKFREMYPGLEPLRVKK